MTNRLEAALDAAGCGWMIFPIHHIQENGTCSCGFKCDSPGKHPRIKGWQEEATDDEARVRAWWTQWPEANIGIVTGRVSNLWILDVDTRRSVERADGTLVPEGEHTLRQLERAFDTLPDTLVIRTGSGGEHHYFAYPGAGDQDYPNRVGFAPGLDIRAQGGYVVGPGSNHVSGHDYAPVVVRALAVPPAWLVSRSAERDPARPDLPDAAGPVGEGGRNDYLTRWAGKLRSADPGLSEEDLFNLLWARNTARCEPPLDLDEVTKIAHSAMRFIPNAGNEVTDDFAGEHQAPPEIPEGADLAWQIGDFLRLDIPAPVPLVHGLIDAGTGIMIAGPGGVGKSWFTMHLALALATGTMFLDHWETRRSRVLVIDEEGHPYGNQERYRMLVNGHDHASLVGVPLYLTVGTGIKVDTPLGLALLQRLIGRYRPDIVIIDSLVRVSSGDEQSAREMANFFAIADAIKRANGTAFCFVHHCRKPGLEMPADLGDLVRGSTEIKNWLDTLFIALPGETSTDMTVHINKQRWHKQPEHPFTVRLLTREDEPWARLGYQGESESIDRSRVGTQNRIMDVIQDLIKRDLEPTPENIGANLALATRTVKDHLAQMVAIGLVTAAPAQYKRNAFLYRPSEDPPLMNGGGNVVMPPGAWSTPTSPDSAA